MKPLLRSIWTVLSSRATSPLIIGFFLLVYIGIAFVTDETLITLMEFTSNSVVLKVLLALLPLNYAARIVKETGIYLRRRRALAGNAVDIPPRLFDETVELSTSPPFADLEKRLGSAGYKTRSTETALAACQGIDSFFVRTFYLAATFCLFAGILVSLSSRTSLRGAIVEGEPLPSPSGTGGTVERILFEPSFGPILSKKLSMEVAASPGESRKVFGIYPPALYQGAFVYPRYLGIAIFVRFSAPDLPAGYEKHAILAIYPPGKEAAAEIPDSPYQIVFSLARPEDGTDPYMTGQMAFLVKLLRGKDVVLSGSVPSGGKYVLNGYSIAIPDSRRLVITDFIRDYGVLLVWTAAILFVVAGVLWLPVRVFFPRREMLFIRQKEYTMRAFSRAEGRERQHGGVLNEALDLLERRDSSLTNDPVN